MDGWVYVARLLDWTGEFNRLRGLRGGGGVVAGLGGSFSREI